MIRKTITTALIVALLAPTLPLHARVALVIGNSNYAQSPLDNPANDAKAVAQALRDAGFEVELLIDQKRAAMRSSIERFGAKLTAKKQPSVFYYAGHAMQLDWRNYLLPTDINIRSAQDVNSQAVDLNDLLQQLTKASSVTGGSSNVVILDACRDNPFGKTANAAKGLSQIDAPTGTLLAYATAPGNVAQDAGAGSNGLYTENLLKEMKVEGAKIEDVLKRVRLSVRLQSKGQQVPWESTSLEEDFYFKPPRTSIKLSREEAEIQFNQELSAWTAARAGQNVTALEEFMRKYPSGKFSELAQYRLDELMIAQKKELATTLDVKAAALARDKAEAALKALGEREQIVALVLTNSKLDEQRVSALSEREAIVKKKLEFESDAQFAREQLAKATAPSAPLVNTPIPGSIEAILTAAITVSKAESLPSNYPIAKPGEIRQGWQNGDLLVYRETPLSGLFRLETTVRQRAFRVFSTQVQMRTGQLLDHSSYPKGTFNGDSSSSDMQMLIRDYQVGKKWSTRYVRGGASAPYWVEGEGQVLSREALDTPAGKFETFKVAINANELNGPQRKYKETWWIDANSRKPIAYEKFETEADGFVRSHRRGVLIAFENDGRPDRD